VGLYLRWATRSLACYDGLRRVIKATTASTITLSPDIDNRPVVLPKHIHTRKSTQNVSVVLVNPIENLR
jgi:hypothetical protein